MPTPNLTRGQSQASGKEVAIESLTLFAYPTGSNGKMKAYQLMNVDENKDKTSIAVEGSYTKYTLSDFPNGTYKFYLVANVFSNDTSQSDLESAYENVDNLLGYMVEFTNTYFTFAGSSDKYLPMSAAPSDFWNGTDADTNYADGVEVSGGATLYADMTFGVAKVTVQVEDEAGGNVGIESASLSAYAQKFPAIENTQSVTTVTDPMTLSNATSVESGTGTGNYADNLKTYTFYVPENTLSNSKMTLGITPADGSSNVDIELGERNDDGQVIAKSVKRGRHFDYLVTRKGTILLSVQKWSPEALAAEINAPFELVILDNRPYISELASGDEKGIRFSTDAEPERVKVVSPKITIKVDGKDKTVDFFNGWIEDGRAMVSINTEIPLETLQTIANSTTETAKYNYYHIQANNLMKRIDIGKFKATPVFTVYPEELTINVNEYFTSNDNTGRATVQFNTNLSGVKCDITSAKWVYADPDTGDTVYEDVKSTLDNSTVFKFNRGDNGNSGTAANGEDIIELGGLLDGQKFWTEKKEMVVTYEVIGAPADWTDEQKKKTVTIKVRPFNSRYIIHFKTLNGQNWVKPHIYVYQCLEVPAGEKNGGKTIGYSEGNNSNAALEYCFTSDIAFKGFKGYGGTYEMDFSAATFSNGFVWNQDLKVQGNVSNPDQDGKKYKYLKMNTHHYEALTKHGRKCSSERCGSEYLDANRIWPGIVMYYETKGDASGWWTYELSGSATPGKALIMFTDAHEGNSSTTWRFPANDKVGVPLFDYDDKEGWFVLKNGSNNEDYVNNRFYDDNPLKGTVTVYYKTSSDVYFNGWGGSATQKFIKMSTYSKDTEWKFFTFKRDEYSSFVIRQYDSWSSGTEYIRNESLGLGTFELYYEGSGATNNRPK